MLLVQQGHSLMAVECVQRHLVDAVQARNPLLSTEIV